VSQLHSTRHLQTMSLCLFAKLILPDLKITSLNIFDKNAFGDSYQVNAAGGDFLTKIFENMKLLFKQLPNTFGHI
ncbi:hypothetical protein, partial [Flavonifractor plautii]|uniref:hypothetical protein n=1 Tax=Flavonifractor plautii TaxID=292800 RepID=UPI003D7E270F